MRTPLLLAGISWLLLCSCSADQTTPSIGGTGGASYSQGSGGVVGGSSSAGGAVSSGGSTSAGGAVSSGGSTSAGGAVSSGGSTSAGGAVSSGGSTSTGGSTSAGGQSNIGGNAAGGISSGGVTAASGGVGNGAGKVGTAGKSSGGSSNSGGKGGVAGKANSGGSAPEGGNVSIGGTSGTAPVGCTREGLQAAVDAYLVAQKAGDPSRMPLASSVKYTENFKTTTSGIWKTALSGATLGLNLLDVTACQTFSEVFVTEGSPQYVIGIRLVIKDGTISEMESVVTQGVVSGSTITSKDWLFDAKAYLACDQSEDWSVVPPSSQSTREELIAAGEAYFKIFSDKSTSVPWGKPCFRLEGGKGCTPAMDQASQSCNIGIPDGITFKNTHWVVDVELNAAVGFTQFAGASPDTHLFRLVDGKIRYVHTLTQGTG